MKKYTLITKKEVAQLFGWKTEKTVARHVREGIIPSECYQVAKTIGKRSG